MNKIQLNGKQFGVEDILDKLNESNLQYWERGIYEFILKWFNNSDFILQHTSGSTGTPKEIKLKKSAMIASATNTLNFFNLRKDENAWLCLPIGNIAGKMMVVRAIVGGLNLLISEPEGTPQLLNEKIDITAMVPLQLQNIINKNIDLSNIKTIIVGGASVNYSLQNSIQEIPSVVYASYGMTETCSHIALQRLNGDFPDRYFKTLNSISIKLNSDECLVINAPSLSLNSITTRDIVKIISPTEFKWLGRFDNVINSGGLKISPERLENDISSVIKTECLIVPVNDDLLGQKLALIIEGEYDEILRDNIIMELNQFINKYQIPKEVYFIESFPRNNSMKIDRNATIKKVNSLYNLD